MQKFLSIKWKIVFTDWGTVQAKVYPPAHPNLLNRPFLYSGYSNAGQQCDIALA